MRWTWRQLTSMRVALILLFLLSLAAVPGSLVPQTSVDEIKAQNFKDAHTTVAPLYEKLGLFNVYSSVWFSAIYILLFVSLAGCIVPRSWQFVGQLRAKPRRRRATSPGSRRTRPGAPRPSRRPCSPQRSACCAAAASAPSPPARRSRRRRASCARPATCCSTSPCSDC